MAVSNFRVTDITPTSAILRWDWTDDSDGASTFEIDVYDVATSGSSFYINPQGIRYDAEQWPITGLTDGVVYTIEVLLFPYAILRFTAEQQATFRDGAVALAAGAPTLTVSGRGQREHGGAVAFNAGAPSITPAPVAQPETLTITLTDITTSSVTVTVVWIGRVFDQILVNLSEPFMNPRGFLLSDGLNTLQITGLRPSVRYAVSANVARLTPPNTFTSISVSVFFAARVAAPTFTAGAPSATAAGVVIPPPPKDAAIAFTAGAPTITARGRPTRIGASTFAAGAPTFTVASERVPPRDAAAIFAAGAPTVTVAEPPLQAPTVGDLAGQVGVAVTFTLPVGQGGIGTYTYALAPIPPGFTWDAAARTLSGTPSASSIGGTALIYTVLSGSQQVDVTLRLNVGASRNPPFRVEVDWDGDGTFGNAHADITANVASISACRRGRDYSAQVYGRAIAGVFTATLIDETRLYERFNQLSPLYNLAIPGRDVRVSLLHNGTYVQIWGGILDEITPRVRRGGYRQVVMRALGPLSLLVAASVNVGMRQNTTAADNAVAVLDAANVPAKYRGTIEGTQRIARFWAQDRNGLEALRDIEETVLGIAHEGRDGLVGMQEDTFRSTARASGLALATVTPTPPGYVPVDGMRVHDPIKSIATVVVVRVRRYSEGAVEVLWTWPGGNVTIPAGDTFRVTAVFPAPDSPAGTIGASSWTTLVAGTDYRALAASSSTRRDSDITVVSDTQGTSTREVVLRNTSAATVRLSRLRMRGVAITEGQPYEIEARNTAAIALYGERPYQVGSTLLSAAEAQDYGDLVLGNYAEPRERVVVAFEDANNVYNPDVSDVVALTTAEDTTDYYVEMVDHKWYRGGQHIVELTMSDQSLSRPRLFTLGDINYGVLGGTEARLGR